MYAITKTFVFEAAHHLRGLPPEHPCSRAHGHSYLVEVELRSDSLDATGFVLDYRDLDAFRRTLDDRFDHRDLNEVVTFNPTAENLAAFLFGVLAQVLADRLGPRGGRDIRVAAVRVSETGKTWAEYRAS